MEARTRAWVPVQPPGECYLVYDTESNRWHWQHVIHRPLRPSPPANPGALLFVLLSYAMVGVIAWFMTH